MIAFSHGSLTITFLGSSWPPSGSTPGLYRASRGRRGAPGLDEDRASGVVRASKRKHRLGRLVGNRVPR